LYRAFYNEPTCRGIIYKSFLGRPKGLGVAQQSCLGVAQQQTVVTERIVTQAERDGATSIAKCGREMCPARGAAGATAKCYAC